MFQVGDILVKRYQLLKPLGHTAKGHQTWLADDLASPIEVSSQNRKYWLSLNWIYRLSQLFSPKIYQKVTVKLLAFSPQMEWEQFKLFEREAQVLQSLAHPFIPRYQNYFEIDQEAGDGIPWFGLVEDYIPGKSLEELLERGEQFSEKRIYTIGQQVLNILSYLHELKPPVLHRDIKPSNLILGDDDNIYLIDFGAVQSQASVTNITFTVVGTSGYTPLEQFWGKAVPSSDLYALGATLIHLLTGISPADLHNQDYQLSFEDKVRVKASLKTWLKKLTEITISYRYQTAREALEDLEKSQFSQEDNSVDYLSINIRKTPVNTKIKLDKSEQELKIYIPAPRLRSLKPLWGTKQFLQDQILTKKQLILGIIIYGLFLVPCSLIMTGIVLKNPDFIIASLEIMGGLSFVTITGLITTYLMMGIGGKTYLQLDQESLKIKEKILGIEYHQDQERINNIVGVFIHQLVNQYKVSINTRKMIYVLGDKLTKEEALWLAKEIQDWLS
ncbi:serine/threonine-protein kinase [Crocosphaera sp. UHCC 0190]|uniref:serine/threonine protein kinase n=1 Tax=Crocosphaera sp. UHCC 0190 TaxID=3110246 RepID=UPI002B1EE8D4|nr:serine/threonine-protein kinase [Crocosphaera sp. UHCC 0190]MEA5510716.1 serine/threonine-protein kinase [Crocosphaera sp. UHCC 0190]